MGKFGLKSRLNWWESGERQDWRVSVGFSWKLMLDCVGKCWLDDAVNWRGRGVKEVYVARGTHSGASDKNWIKLVVITPPFTESLVFKRKMSCCLSFFAQNKNVTF